MRFKVDENLPTEVRQDLRAAGHEAETVADQGLTGAADSVLMEGGRRESLVFLTLDKGIGDARAYPPSSYAGIVLFRPTHSGRRAIRDFIRRHLPAILEADPSGHLLVVTERNIRTR